MENVSYPYRPRLWILIGASLFGLFFLNLAAGNDRGLIINHSLFLSETQATVLYWACTALFFFFGFACVISLVFSQQVELSWAELKAPKNILSSETITVQFSDISRLVLKKAGRQRLLYVYYPTGALMIREFWLPSKTAFDQLCAAIDLRVRGNRQ